MYVYQQLQVVYIASYKFLISSYKLSMFCMMNGLLSCNGSPPQSNISFPKTCKPLNPFSKCVYVCVYLCVCVCVCVRACPYECVVVAFRGVDTSEGN